MKVAVLYNHSAENAPPEDTATLDSAISIRDALQSQGFGAVTVEVWPDSIGQLAQYPCDAFFNICEWVGKDFHLTSQVARVLESSGKAWTGGTAKNLIDLVDKEKMKKQFSHLKIFTPLWNLWEVGKKLKWNGPYPVIVKPIAEHCSVGITQNAVVNNQSELAKRAGYIRRKYGMPVLVEEFIQGREFQVTVLENAKSDLRVLPIIELVFDSRKGFVHLLTYKGKWAKGSKEYALSHFDKARIDNGLRGELEKECKLAFRKLGCRGYVRFDIRVRDNRIYFLEVNINPAVENDPEYSMTMAAKLDGMSFSDLVLLIMSNALATKNRVLNRKYYAISPGTNYLFAKP